MTIMARSMDFKALNAQVRNADTDVSIKECYGQRFIGSGAKHKSITIDGTPGNALGAYLDGAVIEVNGNAQDAVGDTMNDGKIIIHGNAGDALGYAMRGGIIFVRGDAGYRCGIHMKQYQSKRPVIVVGGSAGSFLGEYLAGGIIIVLGLGEDSPPIGNFTGTGMHGGRIYIRTNAELTGSAAATKFPDQVTAEMASVEDMLDIEPYLASFARHFEICAGALKNERFIVLKPNAKNPYKRLYTPN